jgi:hypothetical protein
MEQRRYRSAGRGAVDAEIGDYSGGR